MAKRNPTFSLIGKTLEQDVHNRYGLLLLPAGTVLHSAEIQLLRAHRIEYVHTSERIDSSTSLPPSLVHGSLREAARQYLVTLEQTKSLFERITESSIPPLQQFNEAFFPLLNQALRQSGLLQFFYLKEGSEKYTYRHSINVGILSALIGKLINCSRDEIVLLGQAGLLHDVGKMLIPAEILLKPARLTDWEYEQMKRHTTLGAELLTAMDGGNDPISHCAHLHHERLDGSGYPEGRTGEMIPRLSQIVSVADVFDAICTDRIYKKGTSPFEAAQVLWQLAWEGKLNADIVTRFTHYIATLYVGSHALLNTGEHVKVIMVHTDEPMRPLVRMGDLYLDLRRDRTLSIEKMIG